MSQITTHILDTAAGQPASGVAVTLSQADATASEWKQIAAGTTNADGRIADLLAADVTLPTGCYKLTFATGDYFAAQTPQAENVKCFYPQVEVAFNITDAGAHYHIPLLLSPFGYSTYRGS